MALTELTSASDGTITLGASDAVPVFIVIGDSIAVGTHGGMTGEDRTHDSTNKQYYCKNFDKQLGPSYAAASFAFQYFDQGMYRDSVGSTWDTVGTGPTDQGRFYFQNGISGTQVLSGTTGTCRPRTSGTGHTAADFIDGHPYTGTIGARDLPTDINKPDHDYDLRDTNAMWTMAGYQVLNSMFKKTGGAGAAPHFIHLGSPASIVGQANASSGGILRRASWSTDYSAPVATTDYVDLYTTFRDMYLRPAFDAIVANGDTAYFAGIVIMLGSNDCTNNANNPSTSFHDVCVGNDIPARRVGAKLVALADSIKSALSITDIPTMYLAPVATPLASASGSAANTNSWAGTGLQSLQDATAGDPYATIFSLKSLGNSGGEPEQGNDGVHCSASGNDRLGWRIMDMYYDAFVNQTTPLSISTGSQPAFITS